MPQQTNRILVVDDEEANCDVLSRRLRRAGFTVAEALSAHAALEMLTREPFDLLLLDQMMPGMTGLDLLAILRANTATSDMPVIMVTALNESEQIVAALNQGANDYITKPLDFPVALARIQAQLKRSAATHDARMRADRYALAAQGADSCVWDWDLSSGQVHYSQRWQDEIAQGEPLTHRIEDWLDRIHPNDVERVRAELQSALRNPSANFSSEHRLKLGDSVFAWMSVKGSFQCDNDGVPLRLVASHTNITSEKTLDREYGLPNRFALESALEAWLSPASTLNLPPELGPLALAAVELPDLRLWRDRLGPEKTFRLVQEMQTRVSRFWAHLGYLRNRFVRLGPGQFAFLLENLPSEEQTAAHLAALLEQALAPFSVDNQFIHLSARAGFVHLCLDPHPPTVSHVLHCLQIALDEAVRQGPGKFISYGKDLERKVQQRLEIANELRDALLREEFLVYYQPKIELGTLRPRGFEALVRWNHPQHGILSPVHFIEIAEETGLIVELGRFVLHTACRQMGIWQKSFPVLGNLSISVNVSPAQLKDPGFTASVQSALENEDLAPQSLRLEITESIMISNFEEMRERLEAIKHLGVGLKLDDFGTGYSSLQYLRSLPFDTLKIDQSFIRNWQRDKHLVAAIVEMAHSLGLQIVAEGIESFETADALLRMGCRYGQGYLFAKPLDPELATQYLSQAAKQVSASPEITR